MKLTVSQLRRIIKEEVQKITEATRNPDNLAKDLKRLEPGNMLDIKLHTDGGIIQATITKNPATDEDLMLYDVDPDFEPGPHFLYTITGEDGAEITSTVYATGLVDALGAEGYEFSY